MRRRLEFDKAIASVALATVVATACGPNALQLPNATTSQTSPVVTVPTTPIVRGPIQQGVSFTGDLRTADQITVLPTAAGRVKRVLVDMGSAVRAGDVLAELEPDSPAIELQQTQANLAAARAKLATVRAGGRSENVAAAQATLAQQAARLAGMQAQGRPEDVAAAHAALAAQQAKLQLIQQGGRAEAVQAGRDALDQVQQKLALLERGATDDLRQSAVSAVNTDQAAIAAAEANYAALGGSASADLQSLQQQVDTLAAQVGAATSGVRSADAALVNQPGASVADVQAAQTAYDQAQAALSAARANLNQGNNPTQASIAQAQAALAQAQAQQSAAEATQTALEQKTSGVCAALVSPITGQVSQQPNGTACNAARAAAGAAVDAGNAAVESAQGQLDLLRRGGAPAQQAELQTQVTSASALARAAAARLAALHHGGVDAQRALALAQKDQAQAQLTAALDNLSVAQARLDAARNGTLEAQRKAALAQVEATNQKLTADQVHLEQLVGGPADEEVQQAQDAVDLATQQLALAAQPSSEQEVAAQQALVEQAHQVVFKAQQPYTEYDLEQQRQAVAATSAQLDLAIHPFTDQDLQAAQAGVDQVVAQVAQARLGLDATHILAPVDGIVLERQVSPGALVGPTSPIVTLISPGLDLVVAVDEAGLIDIQPGQSVQVQIAARPNETFAGSVTAVAPAVDQKTRTAAVHIGLADAKGELKPGMQATVSIVTAQKQDALLVPREAIVGQIALSGQANVVVVDSGRAQRLPVHVGMMTDTTVEVIDGLSEGQQVAIGGASALKTGDVVVAAPHTAAQPNGL